MITRNKSHEIGVQTLYAMLLYIQNGQEFAFQDLLETASELPYSDIPLSLKSLLIKALQNFEAIKEELSKYLKEWKFRRLNIVTQAILIYSYALFYYGEDVTKAIVINVAVKLAKTYMPDDDYKFINAVLDGALHA